MAGIYTTERWVLNKTALEAGLRYDYRTQKVFRNQNNVITETFRSFNNISGSFAVNHKIKDGMRWLTNLSLAWRPPSINELYVNGLHCQL
jgi:iron complex outermembrane receptor protein